MTDNQEIFCREYIKDRNGARAYRDAYPNCNSGYDAHAARLIVKDSIKVRIAELMADLSEKVENNACDILRALKEIAYGTDTAYRTTGDRIRALDLLGKNAEGGMWTDKYQDSKDTAKPQTPAEQAMFDDMARQANIRLAKEQNEKRA